MVHDEAHVGAVAREDLELGGDLGHVARADGRREPLGGQDRPDRVGEGQADDVGAGRARGARPHERTDERDLQRQPRGVGQLGPRVAPPRVLGRAHHDDVGLGLREGFGGGVDVVQVDARAVDRARAAGEARHQRGLARVRARAGVVAPGGDEAVDLRGARERGEDTAAEVAEADDEHGGP